MLGSTLTLSYNYGKCQNIIQVAPSDTSRPAPIVGFNNNIMNSPLQIESYRDSVATLHPRMIRYPGGTISDYFNWRKGWVDTAALPPQFNWWKAYEALPMEPENFLGYLEDISAAPLFVLNAFTSNLDDQKAMLQHAKQLSQITFKQTSDLKKIDEKGRRDANLRVYPNPSRTHVTFEFQLKKSKSVKLQIYDVLGRQVMKIDKGFMSTGERVIRINNLPVANQMLFGVLQTGNQRSVTSFFHKGPSSRY